MFHELGWDVIDACHCSQTKEEHKEFVHMSLQSSLSLVTTFLIVINDVKRPNSLLLIDCQVNLY